MDKKEFAIGEKVPFGLKSLKCVKSEHKFECTGCFLDKYNLCNISTERYFGPCGEKYRTDKTDVIFIEDDENSIA